MRKTDPRVYLYAVAVGALSSVAVDGLWLGVGLCIGVVLAVNLVGAAWGAFD